MAPVKRCVMALPLPGFLVLALVLGAAVPGCGRPGLGRVEGRVTFKGRPVPDAVVAFHPENRPQAAGKTDADGRFVLNTFRKGDGAFEGRCQVSIGPYGEVTEEDLNPTAGAPPRGPEERGDIPEIYRSPATSPLAADVVAGKRNQFEFELAQ